MGRRYKLGANLRTKAMKFDLKKCSHGSIFLFNGNYQVPMLKATLKMLNRAHLPHHYDQLQMRKELNAKGMRIDDRMFRKYTYQYLDGCQ